MVEINPLALTKGGEVVALDAKFNFDDNGLYRHHEIVEMRDIAEEDPRDERRHPLGIEIPYRQLDPMTQ